MKFAAALFFLLFWEGCFEFPDLSKASAMLR
jgi:hypothetical protein